MRLTEQSRNHLINWAADYYGTEGVDVYSSIVDYLRDEDEDIIEKYSWPEIYRQAQA